jgi:hypothetical protein
VGDVEVKQDGRYKGGPGHQDDVELIEEIKCKSSSQCEMTTNHFTVSDAEKRKAERDLATGQ